MKKELSTWEIPIDLGDDVAFLKNGEWEFEGISRSDYMKHVSLISPTKAAMYEAAHLKATQDLIIKERYEFMPKAGEIFVANKMET